MGDASLSAAVDLHATMTTPLALTGGKAIRIAPGQSGQPIASFFKYWIEGSELYAMNRDAGSLKFSIHASGQVHLRMERRDLQLLAPALLLDGTDWKNALEIRYLIAADRSRPRPRKLKKGEKALLVNISDGEVLYLNLLVANSGAGHTSTMPPDFGQYQAVWTSPLTDGRQVLLTARVAALDLENQAHITRLRGAEGPKVTFASASQSAHVELTHVFWSGGGNVVLIVPAGSEAIRQLGRPASQLELASDRRQPEVPYSFPDASCDIIAPNGATIATLTLTGAHGSVNVSKNEYVPLPMGSAHLLRHDANLLTGQTFEVPPILLDAVPSIAGIRPRNWQYRVSCTFDGADLSVTLRPLSVSLRAKGDTTASPLLGDERLLLRAPSEGLTVLAHSGQATEPVPLIASLLLYDEVPS